MTHNLREANKIQGMQIKKRVMVGNNEMLVVRASRGQSGIAMTPSTAFMQGGAIQAHKSVWHSKSTVSNLATLAMRFAMIKGIIRTSAS